MEEEGGLQALDTRHQTLDFRLQIQRWKRGDGRNGIADKAMGELHSGEHESGHCTNVLYIR
jgi:hypothetical protein